MLPTGPGRRAPFPLCPRPSSWPVLGLPPPDHPARSTAPGASGTLDREAAGEVRRVGRGSSNCTGARSEFSSGGARIAGAATQVTRPSPKFNNLLPEPLAAGGEASGSALSQPSSEAWPPRSHGPTKRIHALTGSWHLLPGSFLRVGNYKMETPGRQSFLPGGRSPNSHNRSLTRPGRAALAEQRAQVTRGLYLQPPA